MYYQSYKEKKSFPYPPFPCNPTTNGWKMNQSIRNGCVEIGGRYSGNMNICNVRHMFFFDYVAMVIYALQIFGLNLKMGQSGGRFVN